MAEALRTKGHIDGDDQRKRGGDRDIHRGRDSPYRIDQHRVDACGDLVQQLLPVDALQPVHQPAHVSILCVEIGSPAGNIGLDLHIQAVEGLHQLRNQQSQRQYQHQHNAQQGDEKAEKVDGFRRGLLFGLAEQAVQPLFQTGHGHVDKKRQNAARQNGQYQIYQLCGKGQNVRKPQQRYKKRYPYHGNEQRLFCFWFHEKVPFPEDCGSRQQKDRPPALFGIVIGRKGLVKTRERETGRYKSSLRECKRELFSREKAWYTWPEQI